LRLLGLAALVLLGFGSRVLDLGAPSLWYDETYSAEMAGRGLLAISTQLAGDHVPLYYSLLAGWTRLAGSSEYALRFVSVAFGVLSLPLLYGFLRRLFGRRLAFGGATALTCSGFAVYYSQEARMYTLACFLAIACAWSLLRAQRLQTAASWTS